MALLEAETVGIRAARASFGPIVDRVATEGYRLIISRRGQPLAALISVNDLQRLQELERRDRELAAVLRGHGYPVDQWTTPTALEAVSSLVGGER
jgi:prevent-host-death family protein